MSGVNKVMIVGRLGADPELKYTANGTPVTNFNVATSENWTDKSTGQRQERTEWHRIVVFGRLAEVAGQYLAKGRETFIEGRLQTRSWEDQQSGQKKYMTEVIASNLQFLGGGAQARQSDTNAQTASSNAGSKTDQQSGMMDKEYNISQDASFTADDIPF